MALPALFYRIVAQTPLEQLANPALRVGTTLATFLAFALSFAIGLILLRGRPRPRPLPGSPAARVHRLYGARPGSGDARPEAAAPVALIFCFDTLLLFSLIPVLMAAADPHRGGLGASIVAVLRQIVLNPLVIATRPRGCVGGDRVPAAGRARSADGVPAERRCARALFTLGVTSSRRRPRGASAWEVPINVAVKLLMHPLIALAMMALLGPFGDHLDV